LTRLNSDDIYKKISFYFMENVLLYKINNYQENKICLNC
jgi:hypothetical protein